MSIVEVNRALSISNLQEHKISRIKERTFADLTYLNSDDITSRPN